MVNEKKARFQIALRYYKLSIIK